MAPKSEQRIEDKRYKVVPRTLIFLFNNLNQVLLLKGASDKKLWPNLYNGIGGHIEAGEDILEAAERELIEETGISGIPLMFCAQIMIDVSDNTGVSVFVFRGEYNSLRFVNSTEGQLEWVPMDEIEKYPIVEDLPILLPKVADYSPSSSVMLVKYQYQADGKLEIQIH